MSRQLWLFNGFFDMCTYGCVVFFGKNGFSKKSLRQKRPPFFPVILSEKTLFPVIFAT